MKKSGLILFIIALLTGTIGGWSVDRADAYAGFKDIGSHWAKEQIGQAVAKGYVNGYPDGTFKPDAPVTRAQFIKMVVKALEMEHAPEGSVWYTTYVKAAKEATIYQGDADFAEWNMNKEISREHMAWLAVRAADESLVTVESSGITREVVINRYPMTAQDNKVVRTDEFLRKYYEGFLVHTAFSKGILTGFGGNVVGLERTTTRAQAVTVIERILDLRNGTKLVTDKYATAEAELLWLKTNAFTMAPHIFDDPNGSSMKKNYKLENLVFKNTVVHTEVQRIILIDLDDPKDPYRKLLPETDKLGFRTLSNVGKMPNDAYAMYVEYETYSNKNPNLYWGTVKFTTQSYDTPSPYPTDRLVQPSQIITNQSEFGELNPFKVSETGVGKGIMVWVIPNSSYELFPNRGDRGQVVNNPDRPLALRFYVSPVSGESGDIRNIIFYGTTTNHRK